MTSKDQEAFVWIWLPGATDPVVAGRIFQQGNLIFFNYGRSYLKRPDAISLYEPELPLKPGVIHPINGLQMPGSLRDGSPDAWGRRVILNKIVSQGSRRYNNREPDEITYLLESGSDRIGALDFQHSATEYIPRLTGNVSLSELQESARKVEQGIPLSPDLDQAIFHGTSIGGARPKALVESDGNKYVAKFSSSSDVYSVIKAEFLAMRLASLAGIHAAEVSLVNTLGKEVLLVERFDRIRSEHGWMRKGMVSALTLLGLDEMMARYAGYKDLAELVRHRFDNAADTLKELFRRLVFNILCGNTDDHARNHAAFWDGHHLSLTPAYDICPQGRTGNEASQAMLISETNRMSRLDVCLEAARHFLLTEKEAVAIIEQQLETMSNQWEAVCDDAGLNETERHFFWGRQFCNPYVFYGLPQNLTYLADAVGR
jgi:serine/threonine-protein kinase HipA